VEDIRLALENKSFCWYFS